MAIAYRKCGTHPQDFPKQMRKGTARINEDEDTEQESMTKKANMESKAGTK